MTPLYTAIGSTIIFSGYHNARKTFGYSFPLFSFLLKKVGRRKGRMNSENRDQKSCLSAQSQNAKLG